MVPIFKRTYLKGKRIKALASTSPTYMWSFCYHLTVPLSDVVGPRLTFKDDCNATSETHLSLPLLRDKMTQEIESMQLFLWSFLLSLMAPSTNA